MQTQQELFPQQNRPKTLIIPSKDAQNESIQSLKTLRDLWDMRAWNKFHDLEEVREYVKEPSHKNSGHAVYCVMELKEQGISEEVIIAAIMSNYNKTYSNRLCPCLLVDPEIHCKRFIEKKSYTETDCKLCH